MAGNEEEKKDLSINKKELDLMVTNIIPTSRYFEIRFDHMQYQVNDLKEGQKEIRSDMDRRFNEIKFDMNTRFKQVDQRFDQVNAKLDTIIDRPRKTNLDNTARIMNLKVVMSKLDNPFCHSGMLLAGIQGIARFLDPG